MLSDDDVSRIVACLDERFELAALWLFGSEGRGTARSASDLDLALLCRSRAPASAVTEARADLVARLGRDVDLVDLCRASPVLAMQAVRTGRLLLDRDPAVRMRFLTMLPSRYADLRIARAPVERRLLERVRG
jgi:uncharacterized protein